MAPKRTRSVARICEFHLKSALVHFSAQTWIGRNYSCWPFTMEASDKKELLIKLESKNGYSSIAPLVVLTAATLLLIFCSHVLVYRKDRGVVLLWNLDPSTESQIRNKTLVDRVFHNSFHVSRKRGLLFEADVVVFDLDNCVKYEDDVRNLPKRSGQTWILYVGSSVQEIGRLPGSLKHQMDLILSSLLQLR